MGSSTTDASARALERTFTRVRWFGIALGVYQTLGYTPNPGTEVPDSTVPVALAAIGVLLAANIVAAALLRTSPSERTLQRLGAGMFTVDITTLWALVFIYSFEPYSTTWVLLTILVLEGALRYGFRGAMIPVALALGLESYREYLRAGMLESLRGVSLGYWISSVVYRLGILFIVGSVSGGIARNLRRERASAEERARENAELAAGEADARRESTAFQQVILAGVRAEGLEETLESMLDTIRPALGYERLAVLLREGTMLVPVALTGFSEEVRTESVRHGTGVAWQVVTTGEAKIIPDVSREPAYHEVDPTTRSQITLPIQIGTDIIGALDVESERLDAFDDADRRRLERLCAQMALVIHNARLLATEREAVERLHELDAMKSDFIAIASHELRTPLTAIKGSIQTLRRQDDIEDALVEQLLSIADRQSERLARLVEDLLLASGLEADRVHLMLGTTDVGQVITDVLAEVTSPERVHATVAEGLPPLVTDAQRLGQIMRNLIENALKFSAGMVVVDARIAEGTLQIEVSDDGPGIPEGQRDLIFERFHQVGGSLKRNSGGLGLGLFITKRLTEALDGTITVVSEPGDGATFCVRLPIRRAQSSAAIA